MVHIPEGIIATMNYSTEFLVCSQLVVVEIKQDYYEASNLDQSQAQIVQIY